MYQKNQGVAQGLLITYSSAVKFFADFYQNSWQTSSKNNIKQYKTK
jgi:hypothetical protein